MKRPRIRDYREFKDDEICQDGEGIRVSLVDAASEVRELRQRQMVRDALSEHQALASHRPGFCADILKWRAYDAALEHGLAGAIEARDAAYEERTRLGDNLWRNGPAVADVVPDQPDQQMPSGILNGNGDDDDSDDDSELTKARRTRDQAYEQMEVRGDNAWRDMGGTAYGAFAGAFARSNRR